MQRILFAIVFLAALTTAPVASAQNHGAAGVFANYFRHGEVPPQNFWGL